MGRRYQDGTAPQRSLLQVRRDRGPSLGGASVTGDVTGGRVWQVHDEASAGGRQGAGGELPYLPTRSLRAVRYWDSVRQSTICLGGVRYWDSVWWSAICLGTR
eukprot:1985421-Rhodomonas_salina.1